VCLVARDVRIEKNIERNDSTTPKQNKNNNSKIENILPIVMKFAQVLIIVHGIYYFKHTLDFFFFFFSF